MEFETEPNEFGLFRVYTNKLPQRDPEDDVTLLQLADSPNFGEDTVPQTSPSVALGGLAVGDDDPPGKDDNVFAPFKNPTTFYIMDWSHSGTGTISGAEVNRLVHDYIEKPDFNPKDLENFDYYREARLLDKANETLETPFSDANGWIRGKVEIHVPHEGIAYASEQDAPVFEVEVVHRKLIDIVKAAYEDPVSSTYHHVPFKLFCEHPASPNDAPPTMPEPGPSTSSSSTPNDPPPFEKTRLYGETYTATAFAEEHESIQSPRQPGDPDDLEYVAVPLFPASDSTRAASFGNHSLWPIYVFFGSFSKYFRGRPSAFAAHHLAYIPSVSLRHFIHDLSSYVLVSSSQI